MDDILNAIIRLKDYCESHLQCPECNFFVPEKGICRLSYKKPRYWTCDDTIFKGLSFYKEGD